MWVINHRAAVSDHLLPQAYFLMSRLKPIATVFGDPHLYTFDGLEYTFNGKGEFVLVRADTPRVKIDVQGRFEQVEDSPYGTVHATALTAIAAKDNFSSTVEVRLRPRNSQWRYKLDVLVNSRPIFFDRYPQKIQHFPGVTVNYIFFNCKNNLIKFHFSLKIYTPSNVLNQSQVIMMFKSGAGVEVLENRHYMAARVFLPWEFVVKSPLLSQLAFFLNSRFLFTLEPNARIDG